MLSSSGFPVWVDFLGKSVIIHEILPTPSQNQSNLTPFASALVVQQHCQNLSLHVMPCSTCNVERIKWTPAETLWSFSEKMALSFPIIISMCQILSGPEGACTLMPLDTEAALDVAAMFEHTDKNILKSAVGYCPTWFKLQNHECLQTMLCQSNW